MPKLSIVIPCYNEQDNLTFIYDRLQKALGIRRDVEIILVNNGSTDRSEFEFSRQQNLRSDSRFHVVLIPVNLGYGYGILTGLQRAQGKILSWTHADLQTDPEDIIVAYDLYAAALEADETIVKGKRKNRKFVESFFTFGMQIFTFFTLKIYLDDINGQPKIFSREFFEKFIVGRGPNDFSLDLFLLYTAKRNGYLITEIPVHFKKRLHGEAKGGGSWKTRINLIIRTIRYIRGLRNSMSPPFTKLDEYRKI